MTINSHFLVLALLANSKVRFSLLASHRLFELAFAPLLV
jgi:hypothetical protein